MPTYAILHLKTCVHILENEGTMAEVELQQIGTYPITELLHTSSTSTLYQSKQQKKEFLIRLFHTQLTTDEAKETFLVRFKKLKKITHRTIIAVVDAGFTGDNAYLVMENVAGETLQQRITPGTSLRPDQVKPYLSQIADALHYAHVNNVLHGNLHPGVLQAITPTMTRVGEFALLMPELDDVSAAIPYMAPEQLGGHPIFASDQYALAVIVYEWLSGRRPYTATEREALLAQQKKDPLPSLHDLNPGVSPAVEQVVARAL
jgi:serine/threonine protein kinase